MARHAHAPQTLGLLGALAICACTEGEPEPPDVPAELEYCAPVRDWEPARAELEEEVLVLLNEIRARGASCGDEGFAPAGPLTMNPALRCAARRHALDMGELDFFSNLDPDGLGFAERAAMAEYDATPLFQTIGARQSTAEEVVTAIMGSLGLCAQAMDPAANEVGIGHGPDTDAEYVRYWAQVYGVR
ncbi:Cysteine-rich secretory protein family protein [Enhygromyxa salina]|uniref:Cysteine-rich secretory protein family protein n=1 Tax=Enhygromyxa salina TaxID=215803 RepID=A0A2S9XJT7_9BACT|nr:CAP domain-containing protein [Enhygromyxa salina]PRP93097.1 Cysteine-rich secretory protein family protein [Enhygromyxa salina]